jgi:uncharacterized membrane protein YoaK (UPF0700 family)
MGPSPRAKGKNRAADYPIELVVLTRGSPRLMNGNLLPVVLSVIAGSADTTSFLGLGLFSAHVTGNLVILAAHLVARRADNECLIFSVPLFILVLGLTRLLVAALERLNLCVLRPLLFLQFLLLGSSLVFGVTSGHHRAAEARSIIIAGQLSVAAMAVQNALVELSLHRSPTTVVMTINLTRFIMDAGEVVFGRDPAEVAEARQRAKHTWPVIVGFTAGACLGAACFAVGGLKSLGLPAGLALVALIGTSDKGAYVGNTHPNEKGLKHTSDTSVSENEPRWGLSVPE